MEVSTVAGVGVAAYSNGLGTAAAFRNPSGVTFDSVGKLYVADTNNNRIRSIYSTGNHSYFVYLVTA